MDAAPELVESCLALWPLSLTAMMAAELSYLQPEEQEASGSICPLYKTLTPGSHGWIKAAMGERTVGM